MKKTNILLGAAVMLGFCACSKSDLADAYTDPSKIATTTVEKQYAGFLKSNSTYVVPDYWNYFVVLRTTLQHYNQAVGWENGANQYIPGAASITDRWNTYYNFLAQYREVEKVYNAQTAEEKELRRIFMITGAIYFYDQTQQVVDLHGDIPWSQAGMLSTNGGDYKSSYAKYDKAEDIYTKMLDDLKAFATELGSFQVPTSIANAFKTQDFINYGDLNDWKRYCNSLRLRMLTRVSDNPTFASRATSEINEILQNPAQYPLVEANEDNIMMDVYDLNSEIHAKGFRSGLEDWNGNIAGKKMIDHMNDNADPRLRAMFEPGANAGGVYNGLDPLETSSVQAAKIAGGTMAIYNRSALSRNQYFPGLLMTAAEVHFLKAEAYARAGNSASAQAEYEKGIRESIGFYYWVRTISNDATVPTPTAVTEPEILAYLASPDVNWTLATTDEAKIQRIALQKWIHFNVVQPIENWAEVRRLDLEGLNFEQDQANAQKQPPVRWVYPTSELTYNAENYSAVQGKDNLTTRIFWDVE